MTMRQLRDVVIPAVIARPWLRNVARSRASKMLQENLALIIATTIACLHRAACRWREYMRRSFRRAVKLLSRPNPEDLRQAPKASWYREKNARHAREAIRVEHPQSVFRGCRWGN